VRNIFVKKLSILVLLLSLILISGCDGKKPDEGYISKEEVTANIVSKFETKSEYTKYAVSGNLNYFAYSEDKVYPTVNKLNQVFNDLVIETWECSHCGTVNEFVNANCTNKETKCIGSRPNYKFSCSYYLN
jgi:hypothetical protein